MLKTHAMRTRTPRTPGSVTVASLAIALAAWPGCRVRREGEPAPAPAPAASSAPTAAAAPAPEAAAKPPPEPKAPAPDASVDAAPASQDASVDAPAAQDVATDAEPPRGSAVVAHGGVGSAPAQSGVVLSAVHTSLAALASGAEPATAAARGVAMLEDAPELNAGTGASVRLDGEVRMDAAVMDSSGRVAAVVGIDRVKNPVLVALAALAGPSPILAGAGAVGFARAHGHPDYDPITPGAAARRREALERLAGSADAAVPDWAMLESVRTPAASDAGADADAEAGAPALPTALGSVAVLVRVAGGGFAGAVSDGGPTLALSGHVGPAALRGAALYVGSGGAVAVSGHGSSIVQQELARAVYERMQRVLSAKAAVSWGVAQTSDAPVGISAINKISMHSAASAPMAWAEWSSTGVRTGAIE